MRREGDSVGLCKEEGFMGSGSRIFLSPPWMSGIEPQLVAEAFATNYIAPCGPMVDRFEREFAAAIGLSQACAVSSCTAALDLLYHELAVGPGDRVFCSDLTFVASVSPAVRRGAEPVFIDCDEGSWTMDPDLLGEALADAEKAGRLPISEEGIRSGRWALIDYGDVVTHIFYRAEREHYQLEKLWYDAPRVKIKDLR